MWSLHLPCLLSLRLPVGFDFDFRIRYTSIDCVASVVHVVCSMKWSAIASWRVSDFWESSLYKVNARELAQLESWTSTASREIDPDEYSRSSCRVNGCARLFAQLEHTTGKLHVVLRLHITATYHLVGACVCKCFVQTVGKWETNWQFERKLDHCQCLSRFSSLLATPRTKL